MFSWITGSGVFKPDEFDDDKDALTQFYRNHGYLDFEIKDVKFDHPTTNKLVIQFYVYEGKQYKMGAITFTNATMLPANAISPAFDPGPEPKPKGSPADAAWLRSRKLNADFKMKTGSVFTPDGLDKDLTAMEDFYGSQGYIDVQRANGTLRAVRIPNVDTGTMDLEFQVDEGQASSSGADQHPRQHQDQGQGHPARTGDCAGRSLRHGARENQPAAARRAGLF